MGEPVRKVNTTMHQGTVVPFARSTPKTHFIYFVDLRDRPVFHMHAYSDNTLLMTASHPALSFTSALDCVLHAGEKLHKTKLNCVSQKQISAEQSFSAFACINYALQSDIFKANPVEKNEFLHYFIISRVTESEPQVISLSMPDKDPTPFSENAVLDIAVDYAILRALVPPSYPRS
jgi:hypothetical protein